MSTPRRSVRLASREPEPTAAIAQTTSRASSQSARKRTPNKAELPPLPDKTSSAYGGNPRLGLPDEPRAQGGSFAEVFEAARVEAETEAEGLQTIAEPSKSSQAKGKGRASQAQISGEGMTRNEKDSTSRVHPSLNTSQLAPSVQRLSAIPEQAEDDQSQIDLPPRIHRSSDKAISTPRLLLYHFGLSTLPPNQTTTPYQQHILNTLDHFNNYMKKIIVALVCIVGCIHLMQTLLTPPTTMPDGYGPIDPLAQPSIHPKSLKDTFRRFFSVWSDDPYDGYPEDTEGALKEIKYRIDTFRQSHAEVATYAYFLKQWAPLWLVVRKTSDGAIVIPDDFWEALKSRTEAEIGFSDNDSMWKQFFDKNEARLTELFSAQSSKTLEKAMEQYEVVKVDTLLNEVKGVYENLMIEVERAKRYVDETKDYLEWKIGTSEEKMREEALTIAKNTAESVSQRAMAGLNIGNLENLKGYHILAGMHDTMNTVNFIAHALGTLIDPAKTSKTYRPPGPSLLKTPVKYMMNMFMWPNPPLAALQPWREAADCWCAQVEQKVHPDSLSPKRVGQESPQLTSMVQLGVRATKSFYPDQLIIEHIPKGGTLSPEAAPRDVELWVPVANGTTRKALWEEALRGDSYFSQRWPGEGRDKEMAVWIAEARGSLSKEWVRVGRLSYQTADWSHIQGGPLDVDLLSHDVLVDRAVLRITSNWGHPKMTCMYRTRLTGTVAGEREAALARRAAEEEAWRGASVHTIAIS